MSLTSLSVGHSFQHRMLNHINMPTHDIIDFNEAKEVANRLGINEHVSAHYVLTRRYMLEDLFGDETANLIRLLQPQIVYVDTISNNLAQMDHYDPQVVTSLATRAFEFVEIARAPWLYLTLVFPATKT